VTIPQAIVRLNRATIVVGVLLALALRSPLVTTALFLIITAAAIFGRRGSLIYQIGTRLGAGATSNPEDGEDPGLMRFNNTLAALMLGIAQIAFLAGAGLVGWLFAGMTALAAAIALAGFCVGCFLYYRFKLHRWQLFGR
jgi:hypothetical protein